jgi:hypothetical protein
VTHSTVPNVPWQITGNHWLALPCIHPADGSIHALGTLHRGARAAVEFAGGPTFLDGDAPALLRPVIEIDGVQQDLTSGTMVWERALAWLPTFTCTIGDVVVRGTIFAPYGRDADLAGAVYAIGFESRGGAHDIRVRMEGVCGHRQLRVRTPRPTDDASLVSRGANDLVLLEGSAQPGLVAIAIAPDGDANVTTDGLRFSLARTLTLPAGGHAQTAFYVAAGPERDGAEATVAVLRRRGWRALLAGTRDALQQLEQSTGAGRRGSADQSQPPLRVLLRGGPRPGRRALLPGAHPSALALRRGHGPRLGSAHVDAARRAARGRRPRARAPAAHV